jgi:predicted Rdx family selenoprotein|tara:strand:- start:36 stop:233 length:198 start_codon:yes stop_codon:yes gene_type:complete
MGSELFAAGGSYIAITLTPGHIGVFKTALNGEVAFDKDELGRYPTLPDAKELKAKVMNMVAAATV